MIEIFNVIDTLMQCASISNKSHYFLLHLSTSIRTLRKALMLEKFLNICYKDFVKCAFSNIEIKNN